VRAALIALHLIVMALFALPNPSASRGSDWRTIQVQRLIHHWSGRLNVAPDELAHGARAALHSYVLIYPRIVEPLDPYRRWVGVSQGWHLFATAPDHPYDVRVAIDTGDGFHTIRTTVHSKHNWRETQLRHHRVRRIERQLWRTNVVPEWYGWTNWCAVKAFEDFPEATSVRIRQVRWLTPPPGEASGKPPEGHVVRERVIERGPAR
jgi:hypothetical protein